MHQGFFIYIYTLLVITRTHTHTYKFIPMNPLSIFGIHFNRTIIQVCGKIQADRQRRFNHFQQETNHIPNVFAADDCCHLCIHACMCVYLSTLFWSAEIHREKRIYWFTVAVWFYGLLFYFMYSREHTHTHKFGT